MGEVSQKVHAGNVRVTGPGLWGTGHNMGNDDYNNHAPNALVLLPCFLQKFLPVNLRADAQFFPSSMLLRFNLLILRAMQLILLSTN